VPENAVDLSESGEVVPIGTPQPLAVAPDRGLGEFAPSFNVIGPGGSKFAVAISAAANRANAQITVSRVRALLHKRLDEIEKLEHGPDLESLKEITSTAHEIEKMAILAYEGKKTLKAGETSEFESLAIGLVHAAASGAAQGGAKGGFEAKLAKIRKLGSNRKGSVDVDAKKVEEAS
jgi:hypothetical protein